jgi:hypothetical protein
MGWWTSAVEDLAGAAVQGGLMMLMAEELPGGLVLGGSLGARLEVLRRCQTRIELAWGEPILVTVVKTTAIECSNTKYLSIYVTILQLTARALPRTQ